MDLAQLLLPGDQELLLQSIDLDEQVMCFFVVSQARAASCPKCGKQSERVHSRYHRTLTDLCCCESVLRLIWQVRRFFCDNSTCKQATFAEQHPAVAFRYARRTRRLRTPFM